MTDSFIDLNSFIDSNRQKDKPINQKQYMLENRKKFITKERKENNSLSKSATSLSLYSENEEYLNIYKIPKTKKIYRISPIKPKTYMEKTNIYRFKKKIRNIKIDDERKTTKFNTTNNSDDDKVIMISELDRDFSTCEKDNIKEDIKSRKNNDKDKKNKQQDGLKKKGIKQNLQKFIKMNLLNKNKNNYLKNNNDKKKDEPKKTISKNRLNIKKRCEKNLQKMNHPLMNINHIINKLKKNHTVEKSNINNINNVNSIINLNNRKDRIKIKIGNIGSSLFKKINGNGLKINRKKLNELTQTHLDKKTNFNKKQKEFKDKKLYFLNKQFKNLYLKTNKDINSKICNNAINSKTINSNTLNYSSDKIRREYFSLKEKKRNLFHEDKKDYSSSIVKNGKLIFLTNRYNAKNKNFIYCINKKENFTFKEKNNNANKLHIQTNICPGDIKIKKYFNTVFANSFRILKKNITKNVNKSSLLIMSKILLKKDLLKTTMYIRK